MVRLLYFPHPMLLIVHKLSGVDAPIFVEILSLALLFVLEPVPNVKLTLFIVILALALLHALIKITFVSF